MIELSLNIAASEAIQNLEGVEERLRALPRWIAEYALEKTRANWLSGMSPKGVPWAPLAKSTIEARRKRNIQGIEPLLATRKMFNSLRLERGDDYFQVVIDHPAEYHQRGTSRMPARKLAPEDVLPDSWRRDIMEFVGEALDGVGK